MDEREQKANQMLSKYCLICILLMSLVLVMNEVRIFIIDYNVMRVAWLLAVLLLSTPWLIVYVVRPGKVWEKYVCLIVPVIFVGILYALLAYHTLIMFALPILFALYYPDRRILRRVYILESITLVLSHIFETFTKYTFDSPILTLPNMITMGILPRMVELYCIYLVAGNIARNTDQYTAEYMEEQQKREKIQKELIFKFADLCERESQETGEHSRRVCDYMRIMLQHAGFSGEQVELYSIACALHDIGKMEIPKDILMKSGQLTDEEFEIMKQHVEIAGELLEGADTEVLQAAHDIAREHHERYDGKGYLKLKPEETRYISRLFTIVDVWDALVTRRCYKEAWSGEKAAKLIQEESGTHFDPKAVEVFIQAYPELLAAMEQFQQTI